MPDIAMCRGDDCEQRNQCYRYTAMPAMLQTWFKTPPRFNGRCDYFLAIDRGPRLPVQVELRRTGDS